MVGMVYIFSGILSVFLAATMVKTKQYRRKQLWIVAIATALPLFLVASFRYGIGTDYDEYVVLLQSFRYGTIKHTLSVNIEPLFYILDRLVIRLFGTNYQCFFVVTAGVTLFSVFYVIYRDSENPVGSTFLYITMTFFLSSLNTTREHMACCILLLALKYLYDDKPIKFFAVVIIAGLFHYSALAFLIIYVLQKVRITPRKTIVLTMGLFVLRGIVSIIVLSILRYTRYVRYLGGNVGYTTAGILGLIIQLAILLFASYYYCSCIENSNDRDAKKFEILYGCQMMATWCTILSGEVPLISRIKWLFAYPSILLIPFVLKKIPNWKEQKIIEFVVVCAFLIYYYIVIYVAGSYGVLPYKAVF